ncbi:unnamed protein product [Brassica napus]|uniref:(rape) hypothetical protein n=1 Tax=Brassica napus TaxID=3708 RepID=A0A817AF50_BRANA|nr:unnamed protein product [Brassica napus]
MKFIHHSHHLLFSIRERQGGELKGVDMLLLDAKVIKQIIIFNFLEIQIRCHNHLEVNQPSNCLHSSNISCKKA